MKNSLLPSACLVTTLVFGFSAISQGQRTPLATGTQSGPELHQVQGSLDDIQHSLSALSTQPRGPLPFKVEIPGGLANSGAIGSANPRILINNDGLGGTFVVTSVLLKSNVPTSGFEYFSLNSVRIDGTLFDTRTQNLFTAVGSGVRESVDILGAPVRTGSLGSADTPQGGCVPHQIVADAAGTDDIEFKLFARSDISDFDIETIVVSGYKQPNHDVSVTYVPGN